MVLSPFFLFLDIDNFASRVLLWRLILPSGFKAPDPLLVLPSGLILLWKPAPPDPLLVLPSGLRKLVEASLLERCNAPSGLILLRFGFCLRGLYCLRGCTAPIWLLPHVACKSVPRWKQCYDEVLAFGFCTSKLKMSVLLRFVKWNLKLSEQIDRI